MSICHIFEEAHRSYCEVGLIGKVIIYDFRDSDNYLNGIVIITTYIRKLGIIHSKNIRKWPITIKALVIIIYCNTE